MGGLVVVEELELGEGFLHLVDGAGAVNELDGVVGLGECVAGDEGEKGDGLAGASGHFEKTVTLGVEGSLEFEHVAILLWVYAVVREVNYYILYLELHGFGGLGVLEFRRERESEEHRALNLAEPAASTPFNPSVMSSCSLSSTIFLFVSVSGQRTNFVWGLNPRAR